MDSHSSTQTGGSGLQRANNLLQQALKEIHQLERQDTPWFADLNLVTSELELLLSRAPK